MPRGIRFGIDVGAARIGVARSDAAGILASPVETVAHNGRDISRVAALIRQAEHEAPVVEIAVGLPLNMDGSEGSSARHARAWARRLSRRVPEIPLRFVDERLSTVAAHRELSQAGIQTRNHRPVVDQAAAVIILETAMNADRMAQQEDHSEGDMSE